MLLDLAFSPRTQSREATARRRVSVAAASLYRFHQSRRKPVFARSHSARCQRLSLSGPCTRAVTPAFMRAREF